MSAHPLAGVPDTSQADTVLYVRSMLLVACLVAGLSAANPASATTTSPPPSPDIAGYQVVLTDTTSIGETPDVLSAGTLDRAQMLAAAAGADGRYSEIVPVTNKLADTPIPDPKEGFLWNMSLLGTKQVFTDTTGSQVVVAVVDTGVSAHPDLTTVVPGADFIASGGGDGTADRNGHGTHVAGIVAAAYGNGIGGFGMAPQASIMPVRVLNASGYGSDATVALGVRYATDSGADIINLSLGDVVSTEVLKDAVAYAASRGVLVVAAAGNEGNDKPFYPAAHPGVFAVAATANSSDQMALYSNRAPYIKVAAPGSAIYSTTPGGYALMSGTSMAAPHVSGLAALLASQHPDWSAEQIAARITASAKDIGTPGFDTASGFGRIDPVAAVGNLTSPPLPPSPPPTPDPVVKLSAPATATVGSAVWVQADVTGVDRVQFGCGSNTASRPVIGGVVKTLLIVNGHTTCTVSAGNVSDSVSVRAQSRLRAAAAAFRGSLSIVGLISPDQEVSVQQRRDGNWQTVATVKPKRMMFSYRGTKATTRLRAAGTDRADPVTVVVYNSEGSTAGSKMLRTAAWKMSRNGKVSLAKVRNDMVTSTVFGRLS